MKATRRNNALCLLVFVLLLVLIGCDRQMRFRALNFFFTGVPDIDRQTTAKMPENTVQPAPVRHVDLQANQQAIYSHEPYGTKQCRECHRMDVSNSVRQGVENGRQSAMEAPGMLTAPVEELCITCHNDFSAGEIESNGMWVHDPVAEGDCTVCHHPHQSEYPYLIREIPQTLCGQCHKIGAGAMPDHTDEKNCLDCHDPHSGATRFFLKEA